MNSYIEHVKKTKSKAGASKPSQKVGSPFGRFRWPFFLYLPHASGSFRTLSAEMFFQELFYVL